MSFTLFPFIIFCIVLLIQQENLKWRCNGLKMLVSFSFLFFFCSDYKLWSNFFFKKLLLREQNGNKRQLNHNHVTVTHINWKIGLLHTHIHTHIHTQSSTIYFHGIWNGGAGDLFCTEAIVIDFIESSFYCRGHAKENCWLFFFSSFLCVPRPLNVWNLIIITFKGMYIWHRSNGTK